MRRIFEDRVSSIYRELNDIKIFSVYFDFFINNYLNVYRGNLNLKQKNVKIYYKRIRRLRQGRIHIQKSLER